MSTLLVLAILFLQIFHKTDIVSATTQSKKMLQTRVPLVFGKVSVFERAIYLENMKFYAIGGETL